MIQGEVVRLHKGTVCTVNHDGWRASCTIAGFDETKGLWQIHLQDRSFTQLFVPEAALRLSFSLLPSSLRAVRRFREIGYATAQGSCGRGFVAAEFIAKGQPIFEEAPLIVAHSPSPLDETATPLAHHSVRWRAYAKLAAVAKREASTPAGRADGRLQRALAAFDDLGVADVVCPPADVVCPHARVHAARAASGGVPSPHSSTVCALCVSACARGRACGAQVPEHVLTAAQELAAADFACAGHLTPAQLESARAAHTHHIAQTLMRFHSNQFSFDNGAPEFDPQFGAKARRRPASLSLSLSLSLPDAAEIAARCGRGRGEMRSRSRRVVVMPRSRRVVVTVR